MEISEKLNLTRSEKKENQNQQQQKQQEPQACCPRCTQVSLEAFLGDKELSSLHFTRGQMPLSFSKTIPVLFTGIKTTINDLIF